MKTCKTCGRVLSQDGTCYNCAETEGKAPTTSAPEPDNSLRELLFEVSPEPAVKPDEPKAEPLAKPSAVPKEEKKAEKLPPWKIAMQDLTGGEEFDPAPGHDNSSSAVPSQESEPSAEPKQSEQDSEQAEAIAQAQYSPQDGRQQTRGFEYETVEKGVETFMTKNKHADAENPYLDLLKKYGLSPLFLIGAALFCFLSIYLTYAKVNEFIIYIQNALRYKDTLILQGELMGLTPLDIVNETAPANRMILNGYINIIVYLLTLIPACLYLIGFVLNFVALAGSDRARKRAPGCFYIRIAAISNIAAASIVLLAYIAEAYINLAGLPSLYQLVQIIVFFVIQFMSIYVSITVIKITKNLHHVITTGRFSDTFSQLLPKIVIILAFVQLANFVLLFGTATLNDWLAIVQAAGTVLMAFAFAQFSVDYNRLHEMRQSLKKA